MRTERRAVAEWFLGGAVLTCLVPLVGADLLELHHDLYLLVHALLLFVFPATVAYLLLRDARRRRELRGSGAAGLVLAAVWALVAGSVINVERRRLFPARQE